MSKAAFLAPGRRPSFGRKEPLATQRRATPTIDPALLPFHKRRSIHVESIERLAEVRVPAGPCYTSKVAAADAMVASGTTVAIESSVAGESAVATNLALTIETATIALEQADHVAVSRGGSKTQSGYDAEDEAYLSLGDESDDSDLDNALSPDKQLEQDSYLSSVRNSVSTAVGGVAYLLSYAFTAQEPLPVIASGVISARASANIDLDTESLCRALVPALACALSPPDGVGIVVTVKPINASILSANETVQTASASDIAAKGVREESTVCGVNACDEATNTLSVEPVHGSDGAVKAPREAREESIANPVDASVEECDEPENEPVGAVGGSDGVADGPANACTANSVEGCNELVNELVGAVSGADGALSAPVEAKDESDLAADGHSKAVHGPDTEVLIDLSFIVMNDGASKGVAAAVKTALTLEAQVGGSFLLLPHLAERLLSESKPVPRRLRITVDSNKDQASGRAGSVCPDTDKGGGSAEPADGT